MPNSVRPPAFAAEAQSCGTPVVAYRVGGTPEMLIDGETGQLVREGDVAALGEAMKAQLDLDSASSRAMSLRARQFVVTKRSF